MNFSKKLAFCGAFLMMMSCNNVLERDIIPNTLENFPIVASTEATKTVNNGDNTISWGVGDEMSILYTKAESGYGNSTYTRAEGDIFNGSMTSVADVADLYAVYPKNEAVVAPVKVSYTIPAVQTQNGNDNQDHIACANLPLYGIAKSVDMREKVMPVIPMRHVASVIDFVITNTESTPITVKQIKFTSPYELVGVFSTDMTAESLEWAAVSAGKTVTLSVSECEEIAIGGSAAFYATVMPFSGEGDYSIEVLATDAEGKQIVSAKTVNNDCKFPAGKCTKINYSFTKTGEDQNSDYYKVTSEPESWDGVYLVVDDVAGQAFAIGESGYKVAVNIDGDKIVATESLAKYALTVTDANVKHANNSSLEAYNVQNAAGKYIYFSTEEIQVDDDNQKLNTHDDNTYSYYHTFRYDGSGVEMMSSGHSDGFNKYYLGYSSSSFTYTDNSSSRVQLYRLSGVNPSPTPVDPTPSDLTFNLENSTLTSYLDEADKTYTNSNYSTTVVESFTGTRATLDLPNPVSLRWTGNATSINIYEGATPDGAKVKTLSLSSSSSVDIYNLIPGRTYNYATSNGQTGTFTTTGRRRMIKVSDNANQNHARNCRDFGGIVTAKGEKLNFGLIFRGTNMDDVNDAEKSILRNELGIKLDVDLRGGASGSGSGSSWGGGSWGGGSSSTSGKNVSPLGDDIKISNQAYTSGQMDSGVDEKLTITLTDILESVIDGKPVYIHCYIGSDRTGYMCMLLQALLGVSKKECDIDYEITSFAGSMVSGTRPKEYTDNKDFRVKFSSEPDNTPQAVEDYVVNTLGISLDTVKAFRKAMGVNETL